LIFSEELERLRCQMPRLAHIPSYPNWSTAANILEAAVSHVLFPFATAIICAMLPRHFDVFELGKSKKSIKPLKWHNQKVDGSVQTS